jgi:hypothetical protein
VHPENYLERLNAAIAISMQRSLDVLGQERFGAIFRAAGRHPEGLIDRAAFLSKAHQL